MRKYVIAMPTDSSEIFCDLRIGPARSSPISDTIMPPMIATISEVCTAFRTASSSFLPIALAMITLVPRDIPRNEFTISEIIGVFAPTAAMQAFPRSPVKLPTTAMSAALKSCWRMPVIASGKANPRILFHRLPSIIDLLTVFSPLICRKIIAFRSLQV